VATSKPVVPCGKVLPSVLTDPRMTGPGRRRVVFRLPLHFGRVHSSSSWVGGGPWFVGGLFQRRWEKSGLKFNRNKPLHWT